MIKYKTKESPQIVTGCEIHISQASPEKSHGERLPDGNR